MAKPPGLRERKKLAAMERIQQTALDLFDEHGFDAVTIERVAEESDVSPSTVYRYFGTKEHLVLYDSYDPVMISALEATAPGSTPLRMVRDVLRGAMAEISPGDESRIRQRMRYVFSIPAVNAAMLQDTAEIEEILRQTFARQTGRGKDDFELHVFVSSVVAALVTALRYWFDHDDGSSLFDTIERALDVIEHDLEEPPVGQGTSAAGRSG